MGIVNILITKVIDISNFYVCIIKIIKTSVINSIDISIFEIIEIKTLIIAIIRI